MSLQAVLTCTLRGTRFYLTAEGLATDIPERAGRYRDRTDAALALPRMGWAGEPAFAWEPAYLLSDGATI